MGDMFIDENAQFKQLQDKVVSESNDLKPHESRGIKVNLIWKNIFQLVFFHTGFVIAWIIYGFGLSAVQIKWLTVLWVVIIGYGTAVGVTAGAHRLWSHRSYRANRTLRIILMIIYSFVGMNSIFHWVKDHRIHHKYSETNADPHNAKRGFFFSHIGWLMVQRHPEYRRRQREIDLSDIISDPVVMFNKRYERELFYIFCITIPVAVPVIFWDETLLHAILTQCFIRYVLVLHSIWSVNSVAHLWGDHPYNRLISPAENSVVALLTAGEGSHNYHHTFPWDYKASEWPYLRFNTTTLFINLFAKIGWAYDLREASSTLVKKVVQHIGHKSNVSSVIQK